MPFPPVPPPPFFPRVRLPDIGAYRCHNVQHSSNPDQNANFYGRSKVNERRREMEAELRKGFDLPDHFPEAERVSMFGRPPPVPKPPEFHDKRSSHLPPINGF